MFAFVIFYIYICVIEDYMYWLLLKGDGNRVMDYFAWFGCIELWKVYDNWVMEGGYGDILLNWWLFMSMAQFGLMDWLER